MPYLFHRHWHWPTYHVDHHRDLNLLYVLRLFMNFNDMFSVLLVPIFIFQLGYAADIFKQWGASISPTQQGVIWVTGYYFLTRLFVLLAQALVGNWVVKYYGNRGGLLLGLVFYFAYFFTLFFVPTWPILLLLVILFHGFFISLFWPNHHVILSKHALKSHLGEDLSLFQAMHQLGSILAPAAGGFVAIWLGFESMFLISMVLSVVIFVIAAQLSARPEKELFSLKLFWQHLKERWFQERSVSYVGRYAHDAATVLWPVYVFLLLGSVDRVGFLYTLAFFLAFMTTLVVGIYIDHHKSRRSYFFSGSGMALMWLGRIGLTNPWGMAVLDALDRVVGSFHWIVYDSRVFIISPKITRYQYFISREAVISIVAAMLWLIVGILFFVSESAWPWLFVMSAVGVLLTLFLSDRTYE